MGNTSAAVVNITHKFAQWTIDADIGTYQLRQLKPHAIPCTPEAIGPNLIKINDISDPYKHSASCHILLIQSKEMVDMDMNVTTF